MVLPYRTTRLGINLLFRLRTRFLPSCDHHISYTDFTMICEAGTTTNTTGTPVSVPSKEEHLQAKAAPSSTGDCDCAALQARIQQLEAQVAAQARQLETQVEAQVEARTRDLANANQGLQAVNGLVQRQSQTMLQHFACMSHELRTPLNCIVGMASLLHDTPLNQFQQEAVRMIATSGDLMATVVDDVLDFSKLTAGDFTLDVKPQVDLQSTLDSVTTAIQMKADTTGRGLWVRSYIGTNVPQWYETDAKRLQQILYNLLGNAVKFSRDNGYIDLKCNIVNDPSHGKRIQFKVKDYGKGIAAENYDRIFEPFHQENADTSTIYGGTGLGLPITKQLSEKLGGRITVESQVGKWTEFTVDFPYGGEEVTDFGNHVSRLANTSILVVVARPTTDCPVIKWLRDQDIGVELIATCDELEATAQAIEAKRNPNGRGEHYYIPLIHDEAFDEAVYCQFASRHAIQLMTFGYKNIAMAAAHVHSPCRVFPSLFLPILGDLVARLKTGKVERIETTLDSSILIINNQKEAETAASTQASSSEFDYAKIKVLIAEDNRINQRVLTKTLTRLGIHQDNISVVDNGLKAVQVASEKAYDIIFMDMEMPIMNGLEACREITKNKVRMLPIVVFVTAHALDTFRHEAQQAGGFDFISKPFNLEKIGALIQSVPWDSLTETERRMLAVGKPTRNTATLCLE